MANEVAIMTCSGCELPHGAEARYCPSCGLRCGALGFWLSMVPAIAVGLLISTLGVVAGRAAPLSLGDGLVHSLSTIVLGTTVPYFDIGFAFIGAWAAVVAVTDRRLTRAAVVGLALGVYLPTTVALLQVIRAEDLDVTNLAKMGVAAFCGALLAFPLSTRLGDLTKLGAVAHLIPGGRYTASVATTFIAVVLAYALYTLAVITLVIAAVVLGLYIVFKIIGAFTGGGSPRAQLYIPKSGKIDDDGRIVEEGLFFNKPTGQRIDEDGCVVNEGLLGDQRTGLKIDSAGRVLKEGLFVDQQTGIKLKDDGSGKREIVREGIFFDDSTGLEISADGHAEESGLLWNHSAGVVIDAEGVHQVHADLAAGDKNYETTKGETRFKERGLFGLDAGVRVEKGGQGYKERFLGDEEVDLQVDSQGLVKQRRG